MLPAGCLGDLPVQFGRHVDLRAVRRDLHDAPVVIEGNQVHFDMAARFEDGRLTRDQLGGFSRTMEMVTIWSALSTSRVQLLNQ